MTNDKKKASALLAVERAITYPYSRPDHSFTLGINGEIVPIPNFHHETAWFYTQDRVAIVASGSNASPEQLRRKFPSLKDPIHVLRCAIKGWDVVYTGFVCGYGSVPATMIPQKKNDKGKQPTVFVSLVLVNQSQQAKLTKSEKPEYELALLSPRKAKVRLLDFLTHDSERFPEPVYAYICPLLTRIDDKPVALTEIYAKHRQLPSMTQKELQETILAKLDEDDPPTLGQFMLENARHDDERTERNKRLEELGVAKKLEHDDKSYTLQKEGIKTEEEDDGDNKNGDGDDD